MKVTRVTVATLENWNNRGIFSPSVDNGPPPSPRRYTFRDLVAIRVLASLRDAGIDLKGLKRVVAYLKQRKGLSASEALASTMLITDGHDVYEQVDGTISVSALRKPGQAVFHIVALDSIVSEIQQNIRTIRAEKKKAA